jgi:hypothetical protein
VDLGQISESIFVKKQIPKPGPGPLEDQGPAGRKKRAMFGSEGGERGGEEMRRNDDQLLTRYLVGSLSKTLSITDV